MTNEELEALVAQGWTPPKVVDPDLDLVNGFKADEERLLRKLDELQTMQTYETNPPIADYRWLAIGRTHLEQAFMAINRSVFKPSRVKLPEDVA